MIRFLFIVFCLFPLVSVGAEFSSEQKICNEVLKDEKNSSVVSANYIAGVDVNGQSVAPADLDAQLHDVDPLFIPIELDLAQAFGLNFPVGIKLNPVVANLQIFQNGRVFYNDVNLTDKVQYFCKNLDDPVILDVQKQDGQRAGDLVPSSDKIEGEYPVYISE